LSSNGLVLRKAILKIVVSRQKGASRDLRRSGKFICEYTCGDYFNLGVTEAKGHEVGQRQGGKCSGDAEYLSDVLY
jgi:hypothetical protein